MKCVNSISVVPETITLLENDWYYGAYAVVSPSDAECTGVIWSSDNPTIASVGKYSGYIYGNSAGTTLIYATATDGSGVKGSCVVEVEPRTYLQSVCLSPCEMTIPIWQKEGDEEFIVALVEPFDATDTSVVWSSSNSNVVEVQKRTPAINTKNGLAAVFGRSTGTATITATATDGSGRKSTCTVTVVPYIPVGKITMDRSTYTMGVGDSAYLCYEICPSNATNQEVRWSSSNSSVVEVSSVGRITAKYGGVAVITVTTDDGNCISNCMVTVEYCGGSEYRDVTKHTMVLQDDGYYVCSTCGYRIKSPALQDKVILNDEDYYKVRACYLSILYYSKIDKEDDGEHSIRSTALRIIIDDIRSKSQYSHKYDYVGSDGLYKREYTIGNENDNYYMPVSIDYNVIDNDIELTLNNGLVLDVVELFAGWFIPMEYEFMFLDLEDPDANIVDYFCRLAETTGNKYISILLKIAHIVFTVEEMAVTDKVVDIQFSMGADVCESKIVFNSNGDIKKQIHNT